MPTEEIWLAQTLGVCKPHIVATEQRTMLRSTPYALGAQAKGAWFKSGK